MNKNCEYGTVGIKHEMAVSGSIGNQILQRFDCNIPVRAVYFVGDKVLPLKKTLMKYFL